ncbi:YigZ family protein, partial [Roseburia faecis]|nr:YigZ family protein [Roseburia faecis]
MTTPFLTIAQDTTNEIIIKKSRFICSLFRVESEEQAQAAITKINKLHRKATHNCFAYLIGDHDQIQR